MNDTVICKQCGATNEVKFNDMYDINFFIIKGMESAFCECWNCTYSFVTKRTKKFRDEKIKV
jgi:hypothetical protein